MKVTTDVIRTCFRGVPLRYSLTVETYSVTMTELGYSPSQWNLSSMTLLKRQLNTAHKIPSVYEENETLAMQRMQSFKTSILPEIREASAAPQHGTLQRNVENELPSLRRKSVQRRAECAIFDKKRRNMRQYQTTLFSMQDNNTPNGAGSRGCKKELLMRMSMCQTYKLPLAFNLPRQHSSKNYTSPVL